MGAKTLAEKSFPLSFRGPMLLTGPRNPGFSLKSKYRDSSLRSE
jgi:hypothetical protein